MYRTAIEFGVCRKTIEKKNKKKTNRFDIRVHDSDSRYMNVKRRHRKKRIDSNRIESNRIDAIPIVDTWVYEHTLQIFCSGIDQKQQQQQQQQKQQKHGGCQGIERVQNELDMSTSKLAILRRYQHAISDTTPKTADGVF